MNLEIVSPTGEIFNEAVAGFYLTTHSGERGILERHGEFISFFDFSEVRIIPRNHEGQKSLFVALGYVYVKNDNAYIIAQLANEDQAKIEATYQAIKAVQGKEFVEYDAESENIPLV